ncbi:MAG: ModE family transcriptional regulator [Candidatus Gallionella acididurans]|jgi:molybdate transport system regulatory protein|uniref:ModE family transcriptional regulator n=1 Tax=Candidatus Gallionella acididurans TaxID=1796491 RepID=A0A139BQN4_9PROT|nr:MAG: ModE family transcriptional regulator [Candidatus Gallionella acididurans]
MDKKLKIRISYGTNTAMGPGKAELLETIQECGSISKAAKKMGMSYRRAWELVNVMNQCFKYPLVITAQGGTHGGGAEVSELGIAVLQNYRKMEAKVARFAGKELTQILSNLSGI